MPAPSASPELFDLHLDAFLWCNEFEVDGDWLTIRETFDFWVAEDGRLPVEFEGFAVLKFRGRNLPEQMSVRLQFRDLDGQTAGPEWNLAARPSPKVAGWERVVCLAEVRCELVHWEQVLAATIPEIGGRWHLPLAVILEDTLP